MSSTNKHLTIAGTEYFVTPRSSLSRKQVQAQAHNKAAEQDYQLRKFQAAKRQETTGIEEYVAPPQLMGAPVPNTLRRVHAKPSLALRRYSSARQLRDNNNCSKQFLVRATKRYVDALYAKD